MTPLPQVVPELDAQKGARKAEEAYSAAKRARINVEFAVKWT